MSRLIHLSDLHFGTVTPVMSERLLTQLHELKPDLVVISGDLTQRARSDEFRAARDFIRELPQPHLVVPGNHDLAAFRLHERLAYPWQKWKKYISRQLEPVVREPGFVAVGLNTARRVSLHLDWSRGRINDTQLNWVDHQLRSATPEQVRVLVTHHPFLLSDMAHGRGLIGRFDMAWPRLQKAGVDLVLSGHLHLAYAKALKGMIVAQAGSGLSHRLKGEANSFNLIEARRDLIAITQMAWAGDHFSEGHRQIFTRLDGGFVEAVRDGQRVD
ncbi:MAG: metallophosphoesterase family protein [Candidatus Sericytochromatia bacterium]